MEYRVYPRYKDLKEEMLNYDHLATDEIDKIMVKASKYLETEFAKSLGPESYKIEMNNLICIILYCDYSELSRDFTLSFRKSHQFQLLAQIKRQNSKYFHWSTILKDTIQKYGQNYDGGLIGQFHCGMSAVLNISQFNMNIDSPLSTSVQIYVALKFSGDSGMLLEMDNSAGNATWISGMDLSWISRFREEDERYELTASHLYNVCHCFNIL